MEGFRFTPDEWQSVRIAPWIVGTAVIDADGGSPFSVLKEIGAVDEKIESAYHTTEHRTLVRTIARDLTDAPSSGPLVQPERLAGWHEQLEGVLEIVDAKAPGADNQDFREWLYEIAVGTADAAREHWRIRGPRVSEDEQKVLDELATMLGVG
jgi:hypothetical protein